MLSTELPTALLAATAFLSAFWAFASWIRARKAWKTCVEALNFAKSDKYDPVGLARIAEIEASLTELSDSYAALLKSHKRLRSRIGMRAVRERDDGQPEQTDAFSTRNKAELRRQAKASGLLRG